MTFLERIFEQLEKSATAPVMREIRDGKINSVTGGELLALIQQARAFLVARGLKKGDRAVLLAPNSIQWTALDLAIMAEGVVAVPLYARQSATELVGMMKDAMPARIFCDDAAMAAEIEKTWPGAPKISLVEHSFVSETSAPSPPHRHADSDLLTIIYTSGTSGEPKGVVLNARNVNHMLGCTSARLNQLMGETANRDRIFHYLPFCFAGSWILMLSALSRNSTLTLSTDISNLAEELKLAAPDYFLNVPTLLERVRAGIGSAMRQRGTASRIFTRAEEAYARRHNGRGTVSGAFWLWLAGLAIFPAIRKGISPNIKALICGSAPLSVETQLFFTMLEIPVLQVYGLTETTAICTMDDPARPVPGRVGPAIPGVEMALGENGEILVRGPSVFPGYWQRPAETAKALVGGWFHTGDQGDVDETGNWRISGRLKNLIILNSGHNVAPEPLEDALAARLPEAQHVMLTGDQRSFLVALISADASDGLTSEKIQSAIDALNQGLPHYKQIRAFHAVREPFLIENGLLTANGKLKRDAILARHVSDVENLYNKKNA